jgi:hypothetical protein
MIRTLKEVTDYLGQLLALDKTDPREARLIARVIHKELDDWLNQYNTKPR